MSRTSRFAASALACCLAVTGAGFCHAAAPTERAAIRDAGKSHDLRARKLLGSKVDIEGGTAVGTVQDIIFDRDGTIDYLVVSHNGKYVTVPWEAAKFDWAQQTPVVNVNITPARFQAVPTYTSEAYPSFYAPAYREKIYSYYGVKPRREIRREERRNR